MSKITKKDKRRLMFWTLLIFRIAAYLGVFTYKYWSQILSNYNAQETLEKEYEELLASEKILNSEVTKLKDPNYVAKFAREKYMYSKDGEIIIRITE